MTRHNTAFDWNRWYASIPGIPLDWGHIAAPTGKAEGCPVRIAGSHRLGSMLTMRGQNALANALTGHAVNQHPSGQSPLPPSL